MNATPMTHSLMVLVMCSGNPYKIQEILMIGKLEADERSNGGEDCYQEV